MTRIERVNLCRRVRAFHEGFGTSPVDLLSMFDLLPEKNRPYHYRYLCEALHSVGVLAHKDDRNPAPDYLVFSKEAVLIGRDTGRRWWQLKRKAYPYLRKHRQVPGMSVKDIDFRLKILRKKGSFTCPEVWQEYLMLLADAGDHMDLYYEGS